MKPRFRFSLRNDLWATFWVSVWGASISLARSMDPWDGHGWRSSGHILFLLLVLIFVTPFIAAGSLFGRTGTGVVVGVVVMPVVFLLLLPRVQ
jgi:hypothetical protein